MKSADSSHDDGGGGGGSDSVTLMVSGTVQSDGCDLCLSFCLWSSHQPVIWRSHWPHVPHAGMCPTSVWVSIHTHTQSCKSRHLKSKLLKFLTVKHVDSVQDLTLWPVLCVKPSGKRPFKTTEDFFWISSVSAANTGLCSSSSSTSSHQSRTASQGGSSMTQTRPATPAKSWPSSSQRALSSRRSAFLSSSRELKS